MWERNNFVEKIGIKGQKSYMDFQVGIIFQVLSIPKVSKIGIPHFYKGVQLTLYVQEYPNLEMYCTRFEKLPAIEKYMQSDRYILLT